jgi:hypothetical protein
MAEYVKLLLRYRECVQGLKELYGQSQRTLANRDEEIADLTRNLREAHLHSQETRYLLDRTELSVNEEISRMKAELRTTQDVLECLRKSESELMEARTRLVEEKSSSLSLRQRLKRAETSAEVYREEAEARQLMSEDGFKVKLEVLLNTIARLEDAKERAELAEADRERMSCRLKDSEIRIKDLLDEIDRIGREIEKERSSINNDIVSLSETVNETETKLTLLGVEIQSLKRQKEVLEVTVGSLTKSEQEARAYIDELIRKHGEVLHQNSREVAALEVSLEEERNTTRMLRIEVEKQKEKIAKYETERNRIKNQRRDLVEIFRNKFKEKLEA